MTWTTRFGAGLSAAVMLMAVGACGASNSQTTPTGSNSGALGSGASGQSGTRGPPPQAALDACANASSGDACSFADNGHDLTGTCGAPDGNALACQPDGAPDGAGQGTQGQQNQALDASQPAQQGQQQRPPQEAIDACANLSSGDACSFSGQDGSDVIGTCDGPDATHLACKPADAPAGAQGQRPQPPQEAIDACANLSSGDACAFSGRDGSDVIGTCDGPDATHLACKPANAPADGAQGQQQGQPPRPPQEAIDACANLSSGDACSFSGQDGSDVIGTCDGPDATHLACKPANAPADGAQGQQGQRPPPPQEAIDACANLSSGDACSFSGKDGSDVIGTCDGPDATHLACKPANAPTGGSQDQQQGQPPRPPQEALDACASLAKGDECSFTVQNLSLTGTCDTPDASKPLACRPSNLPAPPRS